MYLHQLPAARKSVPELLSDPIALVRDVRTLVEQHRHDKQHHAVTGIPVLKGNFNINHGLKIYILRVLPISRKMPYMLQVFFFR